MGTISIFSGKKKAAEAAYIPVFYY